MSHSEKDRFWKSWAEAAPKKRGRKFRGERAQLWREHFNCHMGTFPENHWLFSGRRFQPWHRGWANFNPFVANVLSLGGGLLPVLVLQLIAEEPRYGNEIMTVIAERTGGQWLANPGAIYPLLNELEEQGMISGSWEDPRKRTTRIYQITPQGQEELDLLTEVIQPKLAEAVDILSGIDNWLAGLPEEPEGSETSD
jgi:DNA-binding PadR family transcriptional regulator